jgi:hypothetical protein
MTTRSMAVVVCGSPVATPTHSGVIDLSRALESTMVSCFQTDKHTDILLPSMATLTGTRNLNGLSAFSIRLPMDMVMLYTHSHYHKSSHRVLYRYKLLDHSISSSFTFPLAPPRLHINFSRGSVLYLFGRDTTNLYYTILQQGGNKSDLSYHSGSRPQ